MIFLSDIEEYGSYKKEKITKNNVKKKNHESKVIKLANKLAGFSRFSQGELAVIKSYVATSKYSKSKSSEVKKINNSYQKKFDYKK